MEVKSTSDLNQLEPHAVWQNFAMLCATPRPSGFEDQVIEKIIAWAKQHQLAYEKDQAGNLLVKAPASVGYENVAVITLQGHVDMVAQADHDHDFTRDPIDAFVDGDWVRAHETTLGADNGIGVAAAMAILTDPDLVHGPLEALFTRSEETSMEGASQLATHWLQGSYLLNLDSEQRGEVTIGCAGGLQINLDEPWPMQAVEKNFLAFELTIQGLQGGHSGVDIHKPLASANRLLPRLLLSLHNRISTLQLSSYQGGSMNNAITRQAKAIVCVPQTQKAAFLEQFETIKKALVDQWKIAEAKLHCACQIQTQLPAKMLSRPESLRFLHLLTSLAYGVERLSSEVPGVVETSNNIGIVNLSNGHFHMDIMARSLLDSAADALIERIEGLCELAGLNPQRSHFYPSWKPVVDSALLKRFQDIHEKIEHKAPRVQVIHAGLECGLLGAKYPAMQLLSFGPTIEGAHSPSERVNIEDVAVFWNILKSFIQSLATDPL